MQKPNLCIAHSGGVCTILNTTAAASIIQARKKNAYGKIFVAEFGLNGLISKRLFDTENLSSDQLNQLSQTPSSAFGSCRYKLPEFSKDPSVYQSIFNTLAQFNIQHLIYQGGNDSQDTTLKLSKAARHFPNPLSVIGLPKTIDNDLQGTDFCPGYPSAAKYIATSTQEAALDTRAMSKNSTQVFILEVMGRHTGWLALASGLLRTQKHQAPHCILTPETPFCESTWLNHVQNTVKSYGFCVIVASEGLVDDSGELLCKQHSKDAFGHSQLGGIGATLNNIIASKTTLKSHWALPDYLQRSAGHLRSLCDVTHARLLGEHAVDALLNNQHTCMLGLQRNPSIKNNTTWSICTINLENCANHEKTMPSSFIDQDTYLISQAARDYLTPLVSGEAIPTFNLGLCDYFDHSMLKLASPHLISQE